MASTGERYTAARKALLDKAVVDRGSTDRTWVSKPEMSDEALVARTGRTHNEWADLIETWAATTGNDVADHPAVATYLEESFDEVDGWWAQTITVGFERITGLRLPYQRSDGTFSCSKSRTVAVEGDVLRKMLLSDEHRSDLFPHQPTELRSKPETKALRLAIGPENAVAIIGLSDVGDGRTTISVQHERLPTFDSVEEWKFYWSEWLDAVAEAVG